MLGIEESRENVLEFCKRQESKTRELESKIPEMIALIDRYFNRDEYKIK